MGDERREGEQGDGDDDVFQTTCQAVVQIDEAARDNAEHEGHGELGRAKPPDKGRGDKDAGEDGQRGDNEGFERREFHRIGRGFKWEWFDYSGLTLNQYGVASPCRTICTVCGFIALS